MYLGPIRIVFVAKRRSCIPFVRFLNRYKSEDALGIENRKTNTLGNFRRTGRLNSNEEDSIHEQNFKLSM